MMAADQKGFIYGVQFLFKRKTLTEGMTACMNVPPAAKCFDSQIYHLEQRSTYCLVSPTQTRGCRRAKPSSSFSTCSVSKLTTGIGKTHGKTGAQVALRWLVQQGIPVIPRSGSAVHQAENLDIFDFQLSDEEMRRLSALRKPRLAGLGHDCNVP